MLTSTAARPGHRLAENRALSTRLARVHLDAMASGGAPSRALVIGPAGSGKSRTLRHLGRTLAERGATVAFAGTAADIRSRPATDVLLVDDGHLLGEAQLAAIAERVADEAAAIILAARPAPRCDVLREIGELLERTQPAIVLGHLTRSDVVAHLATDDERMPSGCIDGVLELSGGTAWLVAESLAIHDPALCADDPHHGAIRDALQDVIAHRLRALPPSVREAVESLSLAPEGGAPPAGREALLETAYAEGLLLRSGQPAPVVRAAVRACVPVERLIEHYSSGVDDVEAERSVRGLLGGLRDERLAAALVDRGDALAQSDPRRAGELYRVAAESGAEPGAIAVRRAGAEWSLGNLDAAGAFLDAASLDPEQPGFDAAADTAAAIWAARGMAAMSDRVYRSFESSSPQTSAHAAIAALSVADRERLLETTSAAPAHTMPSTLAVSMDLLSRGMRETLTGQAHAALGELVRASEMYSASGSAGPVPELPAVISALAAIGLGELDVAHSVLDRALRERHGGRWAQDRLVLWRAWVALQQERAHDVEAAVQSILPTARSLSPRDKLLLDAISIAIARRYHDTPALATAWRGATASLLRARFDLFSHLPLGEFVLTAARLGESDRLRPHFADALAQVDRLGAPPLWSAHLRWTGIQQGILLGRPDDLAPHARALVAAAPYNRLAAMMAQAGRVWTAVLSGSVDADLVEKAALGLASVGLAWDGARLAGHGAARTQDRRVISRLLACARRLHPREDIRPAAVEGEPAAPTSRTRSHTELSPREREVAALVVEGKTYAEIGSSIFISPRTAEHHIARIRRRLGATTRSDLIAKLRLVMEDDASESDELSLPDQRASA